MTALTSDRNVRTKGCGPRVFPVGASMLLYAGALAAINASGYLVKGSTSTTLRGVGVITRRVDNSTGANGDVKAEVSAGCWPFKNSTSTDQITRAHIGMTPYIVDDQTVALTSGSSTRSTTGGQIWDVDDDGTVWIFWGGDEC
ncbi:hypothetical protein [Vitreoscilla filiformis]|uniref:hypothetical protein n=1 Tax=Vitreoscilla filiformis TaxID=63 RepID=UPI000B7A1D1C|nr:hypothetical protein [Vitreoscilla filiformis]